MGAKILVVDDSPAVRKQLTQVISELGHEALLADDGLEAVRMLAGSKPDLIITDILMPKIDGVELIKHISRIPSLEEIPILVITSSNDMDIITKCIELGAVDVLHKPFIPAIFNARIRSCLEHSELRKLTMKAKEIETKEKTGQEIVGSICHNFNQPLTVALACLQMQTRLRSMIQRHYEYIGKGLDNGLVAAIDRLSAEFFTKECPGHDRQYVRQHFLDNEKLLRESIDKISELVSEVRKIVRPASERYVGDSSIMSLSKSQMHTVLLALKDSDLLQRCATRFEAEGCNVITAANGLDARRHIRYSGPHVAVINQDLAQPEETLAVLELKHRRELAIPIVLVSSGDGSAQSMMPPEMMKSAEGSLCHFNAASLDQLVLACKQLLPAPVE